MKLRVAALLLIAIVAVGGVLAWRTGEERGRLDRTFERLARKTGDLAVGDPSLVYFQALDTGDPRHFAWRVYFPPNYRQVLRYGAGGESTSWSSSAQQAIARVRFREGEQGNLEVYTSFWGGSSRMSLGDPPLAEFLRGRWGRLRVEQAGASGLDAIAPDRPAMVLRLTMPDDLREEAREALTKLDQERYIPDVFLLELNPAPPKSPTPRPGG